MTTGVLRVTAACALLVGSLSGAASTDGDPTALRGKAGHTTTSIEPIRSNVRDILDALRAGSDAWAHHELVSQDCVVSFRPDRDTILAGIFIVDSVYIPEGVTVTAADDLALLCRGDIRIEGKLVGRSRGAESTRRRGVMIHLAAEALVQIDGELTAGDGAPGSDPSRLPELRRGGDGGSVLIDAELVRVGGTVAGGRGADRGARFRWRARRKRRHPRGVPCISRQYRGRRSDRRARWRRGCRTSRPARR